MGASESTSRSNGSDSEEDEEEEDQQENNRRSGGSFMRVGAIATAAVGVCLLALGNSNGSDGEEEEEEHRLGGSSMGAGALATAAVGVGVIAAFGISRMLSRSQGRYKMNTDGGCILKHGDRGPGGYGGLLRDPRGEWVIGFRGYVPDTYTLTAELLSIEKGLQLLDHLDLKGAILENDNEQACEFVNGVGEYLGRSNIVCKSWHIIINCRELANKNRIEVNHIRREDNRHAHKLAQMAIEKKEEYKDVIEIPNELMSIQ